jgi:hypothetical protein
MFEPGHQRTVITPGPELEPEPTFQPLKPARTKAALNDGTVRIVKSDLKLTLRLCIWVDREFGIRFFISVNIAILISASDVHIQIIVVTLIPLESALILVISLISFVGTCCFLVVLNML